MGYEDEEVNVYNDEAREELVDDDEITAEEEGFMKGYNEDRVANKEEEE